MNHKAQPMSRLAVQIACSLSLGVASLSSSAAADRLGLPPSPASDEFVHKRTQFQLHTLLTEQRHPKTWNLSSAAQADPQAALEQLFSVDEDVARTFQEVAQDPARMAKLHAASAAVQNALRNGHRIYFYGTGSTGRLAETLESGIWRPFWLRLQADPAWPALAKKLPPDLLNRVRGEITGGDRALISSLEGFEDLQLIGALQLHDNGIGKEDVVFAVTEGGETSAVIGTALAAAEQAGATPDRVWFVYNNPDDVLRPFDRSRKVLDDTRIQKIALPTGPQAITGSTRMQATTTSLYALGLVLEDALRALLLPQFDTATAKRLGFAHSDTLESRLRSFQTLQRTVASSAEQVEAWTRTEAATYQQAHRATYLANAALMPVFVDVTERAPTFRLAPLDPTSALTPSSWIRVVSPTDSRERAWDALLHRPFHGLDARQYKPAFETQVDDPSLLDTALRSLQRAGGEQQTLYDLSWSANNRQRIAPAAGDLGVYLTYPDESVSTLTSDWIKAFNAAKANLIVVSVGQHAASAPNLAAIQTLAPSARRITLDLPKTNDPLNLGRTLALKMLLNAHSTAVMARLGRTVGNTMTAVQPGNLKLIGRATYLLQSHVNSVLSSERWQRAHGATPELSYAEANAAVFEAIKQRSQLPKDLQLPEVELAIVAVLEKLAGGADLNWNKAAQTLNTEGLNGYLSAWQPPPASSAR